MSFCVCEVKIAFIGFEYQCTNLAKLAVMQGHKTTFLSEYRYNKLMYFSLLCILTVSTHVPATTEELRLTPLPTNNEISKTNNLGMCDFMISYSHFSLR